MKSLIISFILISIIPVAVLEGMHAKAGVYEKASVLTGNNAGNNNIPTSGLAENELFWQVDKHTNQIELYMQQKGKPVLLEVKEKQTHNIKTLDIPDHPRQIININ